MPNSKAVMNQEKRKARRDWLNTPAVLINQHGESVSACRTIDVSNTGAKLMLQRRVEVTGPVTILLAANGAVSRRGHIVWQSGKSIGIEFDRPHTTPRD